MEALNERIDRTWLCPSSPVLRCHLSSCFFPPVLSESLRPGLPGDTGLPEKPQEFRQALLTHSSRFHDCLVLSIDFNPSYARKSDRIPRKLLWSFEHAGTSAGGAILNCKRIESDLFLSLEAH